MCTSRFVLQYCHRSVSHYCTITTLPTQRFFHKYIARLKTSTSLNRPSTSLNRPLYFILDSAYELWTTSQFTRIYSTHSSSLLLLDGWRLARIHDKLTYKASTDSQPGPLQNGFWFKENSESNKTAIYLHCQGQSPVKPVYSQHVSKPRSMPCDRLLCCSKWSEIKLFAKTAAGGQSIQSIKANWQFL